MRHHDAYVRAGWVAMLLTAFSCGGGGTGFDGSKSKTSKSNDAAQTQPPADDANTPEEGTSARSPQQVSGAFLMDCADLGPVSASLAMDDTLGTSSGGSGSSGTASYVGCGLYQNGKKVDLSSKTVGLQLFDSSSHPVAIRTAKAPANSPYHVIATIPAAQRTNGTLKLTVTGMPDQSLATKDIKSADDPTLGGAAPGTPGAAGSSSSATVAADGTPQAAAPAKPVLSSVTPGYVWVADSSVFVLGLFDTAALCTGGSVNTSVQGIGASLGLYGGGSGGYGSGGYGSGGNGGYMGQGSGGSTSDGGLNGLFSGGASGSSDSSTPAASPKVTSTITPSSAVFPASDQCFHRFPLAQRALSGDGCLFLLGVDYKVYIFDAKQQHANADLTETNLQAFADANACKF